MDAKRLQISGCDAYWQKYLYRTDLLRAWYCVLPSFWQTLYPSDCTLAEFTSANTAID